MSVTISIIYQKADATFATADDAVADKNSFYPPELITHINEVKTYLTESTILLEPETYSWDQATHQLTINRVVSSTADYYGVVGPNSPRSFGNAAPYIQQAGWTYVTTTTA
jgi:hypothetical protein